MRGQVRRLTGVLGLSVVLSWAAISISAALASIIVLRLSGEDARLVGVPFFIIYIGSALSAYPAGHFMDRLGRRPVLIAGHSLGALGFGLGAVAIAQGSLSLFLAGVTLNAFGAGATYLVRMAAADLYPAERRGRGLSLVVFSAVIGAVLGTVLVAVIQQSVTPNGHGQLLAAWSVAGAASLLAGLVLLALRPDPRDVALQYPQPPSVMKGARGAPGRGTPVALLAATGLVLALAQASMALVMTAVPPHLDHAGLSPRLIAATMTGHIFGMFFFTPWIGQFADRFGRRAALLASVVFLGASSIALATPMPHAGTAVALFGVGVGWSCAFVGASALLADVTRATERARVTAVADIATALFGASAALASGWLLSQGGLRRVGALAMGINVAVLAAAWFVRPGPRAAPSAEPVLLASAGIAHSKSASDRR